MGIVIFRALGETNDKVKLSGEQWEELKKLCLKRGRPLPTRAYTREKAGELAAVIDNQRSQLMSRLSWKCNKDIPWDNSFIELFDSEEGLESLLKLQIFLENAEHEGGFEVGS